MTNTFFKYKDFVSPLDDPLLQFQDQMFLSINHLAFSRLLCCIYLEKYQRLTSHLASSPVELFDVFKRASFNINAELITLLEWLDYDSSDLKSKAVKITNTQELTAFTKRVCFFMNHGSKDLYNFILPSDNAVTLHCQRATFVLKLVLDGQPSSSFHMEFENYGWLKLDNIVHIIWDEDFEEEEKKLNKKRQLPISKCGCTKGGCMVKGRGCTSCTQACKPCNKFKCSCKALCTNPHNNGGDCSKCKESNDIELEEPEGEDAQAIESLPFDDINTYFNQQSKSFIDIPCISKSDSETDSVGSIEDITDESDLDI